MNDNQLNRTRHQGPDEASARVNAIAEPGSTAKNALSVAVASEDVPARYKSSAGRQFLQTFAQQRFALVGLGLICFIMLFCFVGPLIYHTDQRAANIPLAFHRPSGSHLLGTDDTGFDVLGRLMLGGQTSIEIGLAAAIIGTVIGALWGAVAGYVGGLLDSTMMRVVDSLLAIPELLLLLVLSAIIVPSVPMLIAVVSFLSWPVTARLVRGETLSLRTREYVEAAQVLGARSSRKIVRHILPNAIGTIVVSGTFQVADAILALSYLSFLGLGIPPPATNWGNMLGNGLNYALDGYWWLIYPAGVAIVLTVVAFNWVGDGLRDTFDVRLRQR